jgi:hypothetical protein
MSRIPGALSLALLLAVASPAVAAPSALGFGTPIPVASATDFVTWVRVADIDGDGLQDVVYTHSADGKWTFGDRSYTIGLAVQNAGGGFTASDVALGHTSGYRAPIEVGDLDGDGAQDAVVSHLGGFTVLLADGAGGLAAGVDYAGPWTSVQVAGDVDDDGDLDLVSLAADFDAVVWSNDGTGTFTETLRWALPWNLSSDADWTRALLADIDGDGADDLLTVLPWYDDDGWDPLYVYLGDGAGGFDPVGLPTSWAEFPAGLYHAATGDLDGDGTVDVAVNGTDGSFQVLGWDGAGLGTLGTRFTQMYAPLQVDIGDVDADGDDDVVVSDSFDLEILVQSSGVLATAELQPFTWISADTVSTDTLALGDLTGDGCLDVVVFEYGVGLVALPVAGGPCAGTVAVDPVDTVDTGDPADTGWTDPLDTSTPFDTSAPGDTADTEGGTFSRTGSRSLCGLPGLASTMASLLALVLALGRRRR